MSDIKLSLSSATEVTKIQDFKVWGSSIIFIPKSDVSSSAFTKPFTRTKLFLLSPGIKGLTGLKPCTQGYKFFNSLNWDHCVTYFLLHSTLFSSTFYITAQHDMLNVINFLCFRWENQKHKNKKITVNAKR